MESKSDPPWILFLGCLVAVALSAIIFTRLGKTLRISLRRENSLQCCPNFSSLPFLFKYTENYRSPSRAEEEGCHTAIYLTILPLLDDILCELVNMHKNHLLRVIGNEGYHDDDDCCYINEGMIGIRM